MSESDNDPEMGELLGLVVHDLRNPVATISANVSFIREVATFEDEDVNEALEDVEDALQRLTLGLEQLGWVGRWVSGRPAIGPSPGDAREAIQQVLRRVDFHVASELPDAPVEVEAAGSPLVRLVELLVRNAKRHGTPRVRLTHEGVIEIVDDGTAVGEDIRDKLFTLEGQREIKNRADGRYERVIGLLGARTLADAVGARLEVDGTDGAAVFRIKLVLQNGGAH